MAYGWVGYLAKGIDVAMLAAMVVLMVNLNSQLAFFDGNDCGWATHDFETDKGYSVMWVLVQVFLLLYVAASHFFNGIKGETNGDEKEKLLSYGRLFYVAFFSVSTGFFLWAAIVPRCGLLVNVDTGDEKKRESIDETGKAIAYIVLIVAFLEVAHIGATKFGTHSKELGDVARSTTIPTILSYIFGLVGAAALVGSQERVWDPVSDDMPTSPDGTGISNVQYRALEAICEGANGPDKILGLPYDIQKGGNVAFLALIITFSFLALLAHGYLLKEKAVTEDKRRGLKGFLVFFEWGFMVCSGLFLSALAAATVNPICVYSHYTMVHGDRSWGVCFVAIGFIMFIMAQNTAYFAGLKVADVGSTLSGLRDNLLA